MNTAVVIATYMREQVLVDTIKQVLIQDPPADAVLVIDQTQNHEPSTTEFLKAQHQSRNIRWIRHSPPCLPGARNRGVLETDCEIVIFIDDDVLLPQGFVAKHGMNFQDPNVSFVVGQLFEHPDLNFTDYGRLNMTSSPPAPGLIDVGRYHKFAHRGFVRNICGGNFSVRRECYISAGGFDEHFLGAAACEDNDFARRCLAHGYRILYDQDCWLFHKRHQRGGCRIAGNTTNPEWTNSLGWLIGAFRYAEVDHRSFAKRYYACMRVGPLRRENVLQPWRWPWAWMHFFFATYMGWRASREGVASPFARGTH